jgi:hypothetical protein
LADAAAVLAPIVVVVLVILGAVVVVSSVIPRITRHLSSINSLLLSSCDWLTLVLPLL